MYLFGDRFHVQKISNEGDGNKTPRFWGKELMKIY